MTVRSSVPFPISPWRRYFARMIDLFLLAIAFTLAIAWLKSRQLINPIAAFGAANPLLFDAGICLAWMFIEYPLLRWWGNTPGKSLLQLRIRSDSGRSNLLLRCMSVWFIGMGAGLPILTQLCNLAAHFRLRQKGRTSWDDRQGFEVIGTGDLNWLRRSIAAVLLLSGIGFIAFQQLRWNELAPVHEDLVEAFNEGRYVAFLVEDHYQQQGKLPKDLAQLPIAAAAGQAHRLTLDANNGVIRIQGASAGMASRRLYLIPHPTSDKRLIWECRSDEFPIEYLPAGCEFKPYVTGRAEIPASAPAAVKSRQRR
jgi:hypothetical protein